MSAQISLAFGPGSTWTNVLTVIRSSIDATGGLKEWAYRLDVSPTLLSDALNERDRKHVQARWLVILLCSLDEPHRGEVLRVIAAVAGYEVKRAAPATPAEQLARLIDALDDELAPAAKARVLRKARGR